MSRVRHFLRSFRRQESYIARQAEESPRIFCPCCACSVLPFPALSRCKPCKDTVQCTINPFLSRSRLLLFLPQLTAQFRATSVECNAIPLRPRDDYTAPAWRGVFMQNRPTMCHSARAHTRGCSSLSKSDPHGSLLFSHTRCHENLKYHPSSKLSRDDGTLEIRIPLQRDDFLSKFISYTCVQENYRFH